MELNKDLLERCCSWQGAPLTSRVAFINAMKGRTYGAEETLTAWLWFARGWDNAIDAVDRIDARVYR